MYVGVIPNTIDYTEITSGIPHVCGGDPTGMMIRRPVRKVFPMYVGVILVSRTKTLIRARIPHVCGGDP